MRLNRVTLAQLKLPAGKSEALVFDDTLPGFGIRIRAGGKRTWIAQYRLGTKQRRVTLGTTETLDPDEARKRAREALAKVSLGADPQVDKRAAKEQASVTLGAVIPGYLAFAARRQSPLYHIDAKRYLEQHWKPLAETPLNQITRSVVSTRLGEIAAERGAHAANRARATLSAFYSWAIGEGVANANPVVGTNKPAVEAARDRVLTDEELRLAWQCAGAGDFRDALRLLILTGQRREEVGGMLWRELRGDSWQIEADRAKNGLAHDVPISSPAQAILGRRPQRNGRELVFGAGDGPFQGWSNAKTKLDAEILAALRKAHGPKAKLLPWRIHDIRRTVATRMADLGVLPHVVEAVLNHVSGHKAGVAGIYNRSSYSGEKRVALEVWGAHVQNLIGAL